MSLYNELFGMHPATETLLKILSLTLDDVGRLRDVHISHENNLYWIVLFTRNGGHNRKCWGFEGCDDINHDPACVVSVIQRLQDHPLYIKDYDDPDDETYASFVFSVPLPNIEIVEHIYNETKDKRPPMKKFIALIEKIEKKDFSDPYVIKALQVGKSVLDKVLGALEKPPR